MNLDKHKHSPQKHTWDWYLANPVSDARDITDLANEDFRSGMEEILTIDYQRMLGEVTVAATRQAFDRTHELLVVARDHETGRLLAYGWFERGGYAAYSNDEISNQKFIHIRKDIPTTTKIKLLYQLCHQHIAWAAVNAIPVICSTSVLEDHQGFIRVHEDIGYTVGGSYAYLRLIPRMEEL